MAGGAESPNIAALPAIARLGACESARGPDADRHAKPLIYLMTKGSLLDAYSHVDLRLSHRDHGAVDAGHCVLVHVHFIVLQLECSNHRQARRDGEEDVCPPKPQTRRVEAAALLGVGPHEAERVVRCDEAGRACWRAKEHPPALEYQRQHPVEGLHLATDLERVVERHL